MKELKLGNIKATGTTVGDVYFPQTKLLLPFDEPNLLRTVEIDALPLKVTVAFLLLKSLVVVAPFVPSNGNKSVV